MNAKPWLWPDQTIGKQESRDLREEHNAAVNDLHEALEILRLFRRGAAGKSGDFNEWNQAYTPACDRARNLLAKHEIKS